MEERRPYLYILNGHTPVPMDHDVETWARFVDSGDYRVALTRIGEVEASTVFLDRDHTWSRQELPILFETMVFGGGLDGQ